MKKFGNGLPIFGNALPKIFGNLDERPRFTGLRNLCTKAESESEISFMKSRGVKKNAADTFRQRARGKEVEERKRG